MVNMKRTKGEEAAERLTDFVNSATQKDISDFVNALTSEHRTLQEETFKLFLEACKEWAELDKDKNYDERNQFTVKTCRHIADLL